MPFTQKNILVLACSPLVVSALGEWEQCSGSYFLLADKQKVVLELAADVCKLRGGRLADFDNRTTDAIIRNLQICNIDSKMKPNEYYQIKGNFYTVGHLSK